MAKSYNSPIVFKYYSKYILLLFLLISAFSLAQEKLYKRAPLPIEIMFGNDKVNYLSILDLQFNEKSKFGYFGVVSALLPYQNEDASNQIVINNLLTYNFKGNFYATAGLQYHYAKGLIPVAGFQYFRASPKWLFLFNPGLQFTENTNFEGVGIIEYKPKISDKFRLYTRLQGLYNYNFNTSTHDRSFVYVRGGITINKLSFGVGLNLDYYTSLRKREENLGIFIQHLF